MQTQKIIVEVRLDGSAKFSFDPEIHGEDTEEYKKMTNEQKSLQNLAFNLVMKMTGVS